MRQGLSYKEVNKNNKKNKLVTAILLGIDGFLILGVIGSFLMDNPFSVNIINLIILVVFALITYERYKSQSLNLSLVVVKHIDNKEVIESLENEIFNLEYKLGEIKIYQSKKWTNISNLFIPKSYFREAYVTKGMHEVYTINLLLLTGRMLKLRVGGANKDLENTLNTLKKCIPTFKLSNADERDWQALQRKYIDKYLEMQKRIN